jgi:PKD repeat protein
LLITTSAGCSNSITIPLNVNASPTLWIDLNGVCLGTPTAFYEYANVAPGNIVLWEWDFGDGDTAQAKNPVHVYATGGNKTVSLTVTSNANCQITVDTTFFVHLPPVAGFSFDSVCIGMPTTFMNETVLSPTGGTMYWIWHFGDGGVSTLENVLHQYAGTGSYSATLIAYDGGNTCSDTVSHVVDVFDLPVAGFANDDVCVTMPKQFVDLSASFGASITSWQWEFGDGETSMQQHPQHVYTDTGYHTVRLVVVNGLGCADEQLHTVFVHPLPEPAFVFDPPFGNAPTTVTFVNNTPAGDGPHTFAWYINGVLVSTDNQPQHVFDSNGVYTVTLEATSDKGCVQSYTDSIYIVFPVLDVQVDQVTTTQQLQSDGSIVINLKAHVVNVGTIQVNHMDMLASVEFETPISEPWNQVFFASQSGWFDFASGFRVLEPKDFVCVEVANPNGGEDANPHDNRLCVPLEAQMLFANPYPNPATHTLNFLVLLPDDATLIVNEFDALGRTARTPIRVEAVKGSNLVTVDVSANPAGLYVYQLAVGETVVTSKVIVAR